MYQVACVQIDPLWKEFQKNLVKIKTWVKTVADCDAVFFPELATTGYLFSNREELKNFARTSDDPAWDPLRELAQARDIAITFGTPIREGDRIYNSALTLLPDGSLHLYHKIHLFDREKAYFDPGTLPPELVKIKELNVGILICFDWAFPEIWRSLAERGADLVALPSNLVLPGKGQRGVVGHALYNRIFVALINRYGSEDDLNFTGGTRVVGPDGEILGEAPGTGSRAVRVTIDPELSRNKQITENNHLFKDRRPELY